MFSYGILEDGYYSYIQVGWYRLAFFGDIKTMFSFGFSIEVEYANHTKDEEWYGIETVCVLVKWRGKEWPHKP